MERKRPSVEGRFSFPRTIYRFFCDTLLQNFDPIVVGRNTISLKKKTIMKKILFALSVVLLLSSCATNTSFNTFYQDHQDDSDFSLGLSSSLVASFLPDDDIEDIKPLLKKAKHVRILVFSEDAADKTAQFDKFINRSKFDKVVKVKDDGDNIAFFTLENKNKIKEVVLEIGSEDDLVLVGLKTNLTHDDLDSILQ